MVVVHRMATTLLYDLLLDPLSKAVQKISAKFGFTVRAYSASVEGPQLAPRSSQHSTPVTHPHATSALYDLLLAAGEGLGAISRAHRAFGAVPILPQLQPTLTGA